MLTTLPPDNTPDNPAGAPQTAPWRLRPALPSDVTSLKESCMAETAIEDIVRLLTLGQKATLNGRGLSLVVELPDGHLIGFGRVSRWARGAEISDIVISSEWRGQGIGSALIRKLIRVAGELATERVEIGVALHNWRALDLYHRLGFRDLRTVEVDLGNGPEPVLYLEMDLKTGLPLKSPSSE
jgi:ribosomal protein S18 acetylase RimI-like enzyme